MMVKLDQMKKTKPLAVCVDSDGCVFDTMEVKHKECFCPAFIQAFSLQAVSKYARECWEYSNLYSASRGRHRFITLLESLDLLEARPEVAERGFHVPEHEALRKWLNTTKKLNNDGMLAAAQAHPEKAILQNAYTWSLDVNRRVEELVHGVPPFPHAAERLAQISQFADIYIVSATQEAALAREWTENGLMDIVSCVCGQETGTKSEVIHALTEQYEGILMVGDAPGDLKAAKENGALFYPIRPSKESESWKEMGPYIEMFKEGTYAGAAEDQQIAAFEGCLPEHPWWDE